MSKYIKNSILNNATKDVTAKQFKVYTDNERAFVAVKAHDVVRFGLQASLSNKSKIKGATVYLDVDEDADLFLDTFRKYNKHKFAILCHGNRSCIRYYKPYTQEQIKEWFINV